MSELNSNRVAAIGVMTTAARTSMPRRRSIVHGIPGIARSRSKLNGLFWSVSSLTFTGVMIYFVVQSIRNYFQYPTQTSVSIVIDQQAAFPAVTICNYSPFRSDRVLEPLLNYTNALNTTDPTKLLLQLLNALPEFMISKLNEGASVKEYFFPLGIMLLLCEYNGIPCAASDFRSFLSSTYGLCYSFNTQSRDINASQVRSSTDSGGTGRLLLYLYAHSQLYIPLFSPGQFSVVDCFPETHFFFIQK